jgi:BirA family transcriptional regulator, biotin operon repressor / biotin---[acetyl-CoA-carboxylase] ligase
LRSSRSDAALPPELDEALERARDRLGPLAIRVVYFTTIGSTNDVAASLAAAPESFGTVVIADTQTAGRGRRGRTWFSPAGSGLYVSVIVSPARAASDPDRATTLLTLAAGVALAEGVERATGLAPAIKWPNDLLVARRKLAGILAEAVGDAVVLGYGINVRPAAYPPELRDRATSLETELGRPIDRAVVAVETLAALASRYDDLVSGRFDAILDAWRRRSPTHRGARVVWDTPAGPQSGITDGIDALGALLVRVSDRVERIVAGEVRWI